MTSKEESTVPPRDSQHLVHELQVHQIQLEMQNEELREARIQLETLVGKYTDLYDFAPVGYFSLDAEARIREVNLTGAAMLGVERSHLLRRRFSGFVAAANRETFGDFLRQVLADEEKKVCEVALEDEAGRTLWADLQATHVMLLPGSEALCRLAVSDITALKRATKALSLAETLQVINTALKAEVARRKESETSLRKSKRRQSVLLAESRSMEEQLRLLSHQVLHVQEVERKCISRDLHQSLPVDTTTKHRGVTIKKAIAVILAENHLIEGDEDFIIPSEVKTGREAVERVVRLQPHKR